MSSYILPSAFKFVYWSGTSQERPYIYTKLIRLDQLVLKSCLKSAWYLESPVSDRPLPLRWLQLELALTIAGRLLPI